MSPTIAEAIDKYLIDKENARNEKTAHTYGVALKKFKTALAAGGIDPYQTDVQKLDEDHVKWLIKSTKALSAATERLYLAALVDFFQNLEADRIKEVNMARIRLFIKNRARKAPKRLPDFPKDDLPKVLDYVDSLRDAPFEGDTEHLRNLRDRALLLTLADTGLRIHEACKLTRGDISDGKTLIIGKGDKQAIVRFSRRALAAIDDYIAERSKILDGSSGKPLRSLPLFARHDKGAGKKIKPMGTRTGQNIVDQRVAEILGPEAVKNITPHTFRHYFVTTVLDKTQNLKLAQKLARHENIAITQLYAHLSDKELDNGYSRIFDE